MVVNINDTKAAESAVRTVRPPAPHIAVIARAPYEADKEVRQSAEAAEVITDEATAERGDHGNLSSGSTHDAATGLSMPDTPAVASRAMPSMALATGGRLALCLTV